MRQERINTREKKRIEVCERKTKIMEDGGKGRKGWEAEEREKKKKKGRIWRSGKKIYIGEESVETKTVKKGWKR